MQRGMMKIRPRFLICKACCGPQKSRRTPIWKHGRAVYFTHSTLEV